MRAIEALSYYHHYSQKVLFCDLIRSLPKYGLNQRGQTLRQSRGMAITVRMLRGRYQATIIGQVFQPC